MIDPDPPVGRETFFSLLIIASGTSRFMSLDIGPDDRGGLLGIDH